MARDKMTNRLYRFRMTKPVSLQANNNIYMTYAVIADLLTKQSFLMMVSSQNALISVKCVSHNL